MRRIALVLVACLLLAGCATPQGGVEHAPGSQDGDQGPSLAEHLGTERLFIYRQILDTRTECQEGRCPDTNLSGALGKHVCEPCVNESVVQAEEGTVQMRVQGSSGQLTVAGCSERDNFFFNSTYRIVNETSELLVLLGQGHGVHSETGDCDPEYRQSYQTRDRWVVSTYQLGNDTKLDVIPEFNITRVEAWPSGTVQNPEYSEHGLRVACTSPWEQRVTPVWEETVTPNGSSGLSGKADPGAWDEGLVFRFGSFDPGDYRVIGGCAVQSAYVGEVWDRHTNMTVRVTPR